MTAAVILLALSLSCSVDSILIPPFNNERSCVPYDDLIHRAGFHDVPYICVGIEISDNLAYVADWFSGIQLVDMGTPEAPAFVGSISQREVRDVAISGDYVYVAGRGGLTIYLRQCDE